MKKAIFILFVFTSLVACEDAEIPDNIPHCVEQNIKDYVRDYDVRSPNKASLREYLYQGKKVFVFDPGSGFYDYLSIVVDEDCNVVCEVGGIAGVNTCPDFNETAEFIQVVWEDPR